MRDLLPGAGAGGCPGHHGPDTQLVFPLLQSRHVLGDVRDRRAVLQRDRDVLVR